jgi:pimeloyl-ACP methyl ester carboxylesterase
MQVINMDDIFVREFGPSHAPAVVLLHGGGVSGWMWNRSASLLRDYHCLIPDLPEHGQSYCIKPFTIEDSAQRIAELIDSLGYGTPSAKSSSSFERPAATVTHVRPFICGIPCRITPGTE